MTFGQLNEEHLDALIASAKRLLGDNRYRYCFELALNTIESHKPGFVCQSLDCHFVTLYGCNIKSMKRLTCLVQYVVSDIDHVVDRV